jgi:hypothetical protein
MKKILTPLLISITYMGLNASSMALSGSIITNTWISKSAWYCQNGSNSSNLVLDPEKPYNLLAWAQGPQSIATSIVSANLLLPSGTTSMFKALTLGSNSTGVVFQEYFTNISDMNLICPAQSNAIFTINILNQTNYFTNIMGADIYPPAPLISAVSNAIWYPQGYLVIANPKQPVTISWPGTNGLQSRLTIYAAGNFSGFQTNLNNTNVYTFSTNVVAQLPSGVLIPVLLNEWTQQANFNNFCFYIPPDPFEGNPLTAFKQHFLLQTSSLPPVDYIPKIGTKGDYYGFGYGPYSFKLISPVSTSFTSPLGVIKSTKISYQNAGFVFSSGVMSKATLDSQFPNGTYTFSTGQKLSISGDSYPQAPRILTVNGASPVWTNGMLQLSANRSNNIVWTGFSSYAPFTNCGLENIQIPVPADWGTLSFDGIGTNSTICPAAGVGGNSVVTNLVLPANSLQTNVNYFMSIQYGALTAVSNQPCLSGAGYTTTTIVPIIAN